ncbi:MAG: SET domain-containing protein-lysine N-methyltransferase [Planctomycetaceae bacterium]|nr:SET domain-containing protein-lysine N-methyltransferase [Planctomycetaceae bacterium]
MNAPEPPALYVRKVRGMGRGVFAGRAFRKGEIIEVCPVIRLPNPTAGLPGGGLEHYVFKWGTGGVELAVALGYGSLYNHSPNFNARFTPRTARDDIVFRAARDIAVGEQILIDYEWDDSDYAMFQGPPQSQAEHG